MGHHRRAAGAGCMEPAEPSGQSVTRVRISHGSPGWAWSRASTLKLNLEGSGPGPGHPTATGGDG